MCVCVCSLIAVLLSWCRLCVMCCCRGGRAGRITQGWGDRSCEMYNPDYTHPSLLAGPATPPQLSPAGCTQVELPRGGEDQGIIRLNTMHLCRTCCIAMNRLEELAEKKGEAKAQPWREVGALSLCFFQCVHVCGCVRVCVHVLACVTSARCVRQCCSVPVHRRWTRP